jgi:hypothetical protein
MTSLQALGVLITGIIGLGLLAAVYVYGAWRIGQRRGVGVLLPLWLIIAVSVAAVAVFRLHRQFSAIGNTPSVATDLKLFLGGLALALASLGVATLSVRKRLQDNPGAPLTPRAMAAGIGAFFTGFALALSPVILLYLARSSGS